MLDESKYIQAHSQESLVEGMPIGIKININIGRDLTDEEKKLIRRSADQLFNKILEGHIRGNAEFMANAAKEKADVLKLFDGKLIYVEEIPNGYGASPEYCIFPWFIVTTGIGRIKIGWRKRVIHIDWTDTLQKKKTEELFPNEDVTKNSNYEETRYIHAWGYEKAKEYLDIIHKVD